MAKAVENIISKAEELAELIEAVWDLHLESLGGSQWSDLELYNEGKDEWDKISTIQLGVLLNQLSVWREPALHPLD